MKRFFAIFILLSLLMSITAFASGEQPMESASGEASASAEAPPTRNDGKTRIRVIETTDIHGYLMDTSSGDESTFQYRLAYIAQVVNDARASEDYADVLLLDGGDTYQGTPVSNLIFGSALRAAMDAMDYDAAALGNHEFDWGVTEYCADPDGTVPAYEIGAFSGDPDIPILAYDLYYADTGERVDFTKDYVIVEKAGYTVALIGYIPDYRMDIMAERIDPYGIDGDLKKLAARVEEINALEQPDVTIVMTHAAPEPVADAMDPDEVDLVTGGHSHAGVYGAAKSGVAYIQGACYGQGYASATLAIDTDGTVTVEEPMYTPITGNRTALYDTEENAALLDDTVLAISHAAWEAVGDEMSEVLGYIDTPVDQTRTGDNGATYAGNWITGLMLRATEPYGAVAAFYNSGGIRTGFRIPAGETERVLTAGDIYTIAPFCNYLYVYELTGAELAQQLKDGFRNGNYGDQMSGLTFTYEVGGSGRNAEVTIVSITLDDGTEVDIHGDETTYRICTSNYSGTLAGGVFEKKEPIYPAAEAPIDNITMIDLLREEARDNEGYIAVDTGVRGVCLNADASGETGGESSS